MTDDLDIDNDGFPITRPPEIELPPVLTEIVDLDSITNEISPELLETMKGWGLPETEG